MRSLSQFLIQVLDGLIQNWVLSIQIIIYCWDYFNVRFLLRNPQIHDCQDRYLA
jgi:hypothetical protein